ncbi:hypothetical protein NHX12_024870 [Muraenolepis orangiensis]|uniref:Uncharacterized protein n=1 Tax=Muraenolepis orangiensis TaxID=630683 RepID=A0A9Q0EIB4_9TELE|nr:hypothetical protein NHX12_024870 [Muraenolepis orangiensis]
MKQDRKQENEECTHLLSVRCRWGLERRTSSCSDALRYSGLLGGAAPPVMMWSKSPKAHFVENQLRVSSAGTWTLPDLDTGQEPGPYLTWTLELTWTAPGTDLDRTWTGPRTDLERT